MKKTYINPTTKVVELGATTLICQSNLGYGGKEENGIAGSRIRGTRTKDGSLEDLFE